MELLFIGLAVGAVIAFFVFKMLMGKMGKKRKH